MRLSADHRNLIWLLGVPPNGTLARQLLQDFTLKQAARKEYRLQQHLKHALPDEQVRAYYEAKLQELSESGAAPLGLSLPSEWRAPKVEEGWRAGTAGLKEEVKLEEKELEGEAKEPREREEASASASASSLPTPPPPVVKGSAGKAPSGLPAAAGAGAGSHGERGGALWSPLGWSQSRTLAHSDRRSEGDEYGHILTAAELKTWRSQDQEGNKYSSALGGLSQGAPGGVGAGAAAGGDDFTESGAAAKEELKEELPEAPGAGDALAEVRESLRVHFREPMRCEVRERTVRVACHVRYLPDSTLDEKDLCILLRMIAPKHVVLLPSPEGSDISSSSTGPNIASHFSKASACAGLSSSGAGACAPPEIHVFGSKDPILQFPRFGSLKRKVSFNPEVWTKMSFSKTSDDIRVSRVRATPSALPDGTEATSRVLELGVPRATAVPSGKDAAAEEADADGVGAGAGAGEPLSRAGALFLSLAKEPLNLSSLKEQLYCADWGAGQSQVQNHIDFRAPKADANKPWSARVLVANEKATLAWKTFSGPCSQDRDHSKKEGAPILRLEGVPGEEFFTARAALYKRCALL
jgi:hypothetical protein